jgi:hypothetical protein
MSMSSYDCFRVALMHKVSTSREYSFRTCPNLLFRYEVNLYACLVGVWNKALSADKHMSGPWSVGSPESGYTLQLVCGKHTPKPPGARRTMRDAVAVLKEGFDPIVDEGTGRDLAELMVLGLSTELFDFQNMSTILLRQHGAPVVSAVVRVLGPLLAEMPLIATRRSARRAGHARVLLDGMSSWLEQLGVDLIMLPAHDDALDTWIYGFGFVRASEEELAAIRRHLHMVLFPATTVLKLPVAVSARPPRPTPPIRAPEAAAQQRPRIRIKRSGARVSMPKALRLAPPKAVEVEASRASLRPRREIKGAGSYAEMARGGLESTSENSKGAGGSRDGRSCGVLRIQIPVRSKSGRTLKRPRHAEDSFEQGRGPLLSAQVAKRARGGAGEQMDGIFEKGLQRLVRGNVWIEEPHVPEEWRDVV